jgi:glycyl-tRNA synthetase
MEASIISHPKTWVASGHIANFNDVAVVCKSCKKATKIDKSEVGKVKCDCGGEYDIKGEFSLMFKTSVGALDKTEAYLRGETAQGMFMDFKLIQQTSRMHLPFGILQIGRCFRNEIAPRDFLFRSREFHIGEFEFFINPEEKTCNLLTDKHKKIKFKILDAETQNSGSEDLRETTIGEMLDEGRLDEWHAYWLAEQITWYYSLGLLEIKIREHRKDELSHYSSATFDVDYLYPFGSRELGGIANRGQYDLTQHSKESKQNLEIFDDKYKKKVLPRVIEPTFGMERAFLAILTKAYNHDKERDNVVLKIPAKLAPFKAAVFPIIKSDEYNKIAEDIVNDLRKEWNVTYDKSGSIGRRYARNDEIGTPYCITIDDISLKENDITIRDRDSKKQIRVKIKNLKDVLRKLIYSEIAFEKAGIIKPKTVVLSGFMPNSAEEIIGSKALGHSCRHLKAGDFISIEDDKLIVQLRHKNIKLYSSPLRGKHQLLNTALALKTVNEVLGLDDTEIIFKGINNVIKNSGIQGRYETVCEKPKIIFDSAHNLEGVETFIREFRTEFTSYSKRTLIFGAMKDKDIKGMLNKLEPFFDVILITQVQVERAAAAKDILDQITDRKDDFCEIENPADFILNFMDKAGDECLVVLGSMYLLGEIKFRIINKNA